MIVLGNFIVNFYFKFSIFNTIQNSGVTANEITPLFHLSISISECSDTKAFHKLFALLRTDKAEEYIIP